MQPSLQIPKRWDFQNKPSPTTGGAAIPARDSFFQPGWKISAASVSCIARTQQSANTPTRGVVVVLTELRTSLTKLRRPNGPSNCCFHTRNCVRKPNKCLMKALCRSVQDNAVRASEICQSTQLSDDLQAPSSGRRSTQSTLPKQKTPSTKTHHLVIDTVDERRWGLTS